MSLMSASLIFLLCLVSFSNGCMPSVLVQPLTDLGWNGMNVQLTSFDFPIFCPDIPGFSCGPAYGQLNTDDVDTNIFLADYY